MVWSVNMIFFFSVFIIIIVECFSTTQTFDYTGGAQNFVIPSDVSTLEVTACGAGGQGSSRQSSSLGGCMTCTVGVTSGTTYYIYVGHQTNKYNGGGDGYSGGESCNGGGGSDIRSTSSSYSSRLVVGGGGGKIYNLIFQ